MKKQKKKVQVKARPKPNSKREAMTIEGFIRDFNNRFKK